MLPGAISRAAALDISGAGSAFSILSMAPLAIALRSLRVFRHDVEQQHRHAGIGDLGGDAAAHHAGADDAGFA